MHFDNWIHVGVSTCTRDCGYRLQYRRLIIHFSLTSLHIPYAVSKPPQQYAQSFDVLPGTRNSFSSTLPSYRSSLPYISSHFPRATYSAPFLFQCCLYSAAVQNVSAQPPASVFGSLAWGFANPVGAVGGFFIGGSLFDSDMVPFFDESGGLTPAVCLCCCLMELLTLCRAGRIFYILRRCSCVAIFMTGKGDFACALSLAVEFSFVKMVEYNILSRSIARRAIFLLGSMLLIAAPNASNHSLLPLGQKFCPLGIPVRFIQRCCPRSIGCCSINCGRMHWLRFIFVAATVVRATCIPRTVRGLQRS